jgi:hypothetical protein
MKLRIRATIFSTFLLLLLIACTDNKNSFKEPVFKKVPELEEIKPLKPVKIKLKRNTEGNYSWDLTGNNTEQIIEADQKLRRALDH